MKNAIDLRIHHGDGKTEPVQFEVKRLFNAGWVGRNQAALQHHIDELAAVGVPTPKHVPTLFALGNFLLTTSDSIQVHGEDTSGEVEYVLLWHKGKILVGVGSDHTDRRLEKHSLPKAKNLCMNVMAADVWPFDEVQEHFDDLRLECSVTREGKVSLYQQDTLGSLLGPSYWISDLEKRLGRMEDGLVFFSGTIGTVEGLVTGEAYSFKMDDPVLKRSIEHRYACEVLTGAIEDY
jgi:hypothetical protein